MENINAVRLIGTIGETAPDKGFVQVLTTAISRGAEYVTSHAVQIAGEFDEKLFKKGNTIDIYGELAMKDMPNGAKRTIVKAARIAKATKKTEHVNVCKVIGETARAYEYFPPAMGRRAFGNLLVRMGEMFARAVLFNHKARTFDQNCPQGSTVEVVGRLNYRENKVIDPESGQERLVRLTEIIADPDMTKILQTASKEDPFAGTPAESAQGPEQPPVDSDGIPF